MKKIVFFPALAMLIAAACTSCQEDNNDNGGGLPGQEYTLGDGSDNYEVEGNVTLTYPNKYMLKGFVYVPNGATLTIEPGVIIKGDKATKSNHHCRTRRKTHCRWYSRTSYRLHLGTTCRKP